MNYEQRIEEVEKEIAEFNYERMKRLEQAQQANAQLQQELTDINQAMLTRQGEIICLKRLIAEEEPE